MSAKPFYISASRLKKFTQCSQSYYCSYVLKLPDESNDGARMGTICHSIFECLLNPRHLHLYEKAVAEPSTVKNSPTLERYIRKCLKKEGMAEALFDKIDSMVIVGLKTDFFCKGGEMQEPEIKFALESKNPEYKILGFIDKPSVYQGKYIRICDYKSSKAKFLSKELDSNVQGMMYSLAAQKLWPDKIPVIDFLFLQFPDDPIQRVKFTPAQLKGFEIMLGVMYQQMKNFTPQDALKNMAANQGFPTKEEGFCKKISCGRAKYKGELKKDGSVMWACSHKFPYDYYALCDEEGTVLKTSMKEDLKANEEKGEFVILKHYAGCPAYN